MDLKNRIPKKQLPSKLSVTSKPFEKTEDKTIPDVIDIVALLIFGFTFMFIPLGFILELVYDKEVIKILDFIGLELLLNPLQFPFPGAS